MKLEYRSDRQTAEQNWAAGGRKTDSWWYRLWVGRFQLVWRVYCHRNRSFGDRWVFQPEVIYDRKRRGQEGDE